MPAVEPVSAIYLDHHDRIEKAIAAICRRQRLRRDEADEFASDARLHLIKGDYAVLRAFRGRSSFQAFIHAVLSHFFQDWRNARWGKWRPSAEARRQGPVAVRLETLILRDRYTFDEAFEILRTNLQIAVPRHDLEALWNTLPERTRRSFASECELQQIPASAGGPDAGLARTLAAATASTACETLARAIAALPTQDGLILALRYYDGLRVQQIAKALRLEAKPLYRRIERILSELRRRLEGAGISAAEILEAMAAEGFEAIGEGAPGESARAVRRFDRGASAPMADGRAQ